MSTSTADVSSPVKLPVPPQAGSRSTTRTCLLVVSLLSALGWADVACYNPYQAGMEALVQGDLEAARSAAEQGLRQSPDDARLHLLYARVLVDLRDWAGAAHHASLALSAGELPGELTASAHLTAGQAYLGTDQLIDGALHLVAANNLGARANDHELRTLVSLGAERALIEDRPGDALRLLRALYRLYSEVDESSPPDLDGRILDAGEAYARQLVNAGEQERAVSTLTDLAHAYPGAPRILLLLGRLQLRMGHTEQAMETFQSFLDRPGPIPRAERLDQLARAAAEVFRWDLAVPFFEQAIEADPDRVASYIGLAELHYSTARFNEGNQVLDRLVDRVAQNQAISQSDALLEAYQAALQAGQADAAVGYLERGYVSRPDIQLAIALAEVYLRREQVAQAEGLLEDFIARSERPAESARAVADWYRERGLTAIAIHYYQEALSRQEQPGDLYLRLGEAYAEIGWTYDLVAAMDAHVQSAGGSRSARLEAAGLLERYQQWRDAARLLGPLYDAEAMDEVAWQLARAYHLGGEPQREAAIYEDLVRSAQDPGPMTFQVARVFLDRGAYRDAIGWLEQATQYDSISRQAYLELGRAQQMLNQFDRMWDAYQEVVDRSEDPMRAYEEILDLLQPRSFWPQAVELLQRMLVLQPQRDDLRLQLAERLLLSGDTRRIQQAYVDYITSAGNPGEAAQSAVWSLSRNRRQSMAAAILQEVRERQPRLAGLDLATARLHLDLARGAASARRMELEQVHMASARHAFQQLLSTGIQDPGRLVQAAGMMANAGFYDLAAQAYDQARTLGTPPDALGTGYAEALIRTGRDIDLAVAFLRQEIPSSASPIQLALDSAELLRGQGQLDQAISLAELASELATADDERITAFHVVANLLLEDGRTEQLVEMANRLVERSRDRLAALQASARALAEGGLYPQARARLELALSLAPNQTDLIEDLGRIDILSGDTSSALARFDQLAGQSGSPWRAWWNYARLFDSQNRFDTALIALQHAREAGGDTPELLVDLGRLEAHLGHLDSAVESFAQALERVERQAQSVTRRRHLVDQILGTLAHLGRYDLVDAQLRWVLGDSHLRPDYLLEAADLAMERGDLDRARQLIRSHLEEGGAVEAALDLELSHGYLEESIGRLDHLALDGNVNEATRLLGLYLDRISQEIGGDTLSLWIDSLEERGADVSALQRRLALLLARRGRYEEAGDLFSRSPTRPEEDRTAQATLSALQAGLDPDGEVWTHLEALANQGGQRSLAFIESVLSAACVTGDPQQVDAGLALAAFRSGSLPLHLAHLDWLLSQGQTGRALDLAEDIQAREGRPEEEVLDGMSLHEAVVAAIELFAHHGYLAEAGDLANREIHQSPTPDERFCLAARYAYQLGETARMSALIAQYRELTADHPPSLLSLGRSLAEAGAAEEVFTLLEPILRSGSEQQAREALRLSVHAALVCNRSDLAGPPIDLAITRLGSRYRQLVGGAEYLERLGQWAPASQRYLQALEMIPGRSSVVADAIRNLVRSGQSMQILSLLDRTGGPAGNRTEVLLALDQATEIPLDPDFQVTLRERTLAMDPGSFQRRAELLLAYLDRDDRDQARRLLGELDQVAAREPMNRHTLLQTLSTSSHAITVEYARTIIQQADSDWESLWLAAGILRDNGEDISQVLSSVTSILDRIRNEERLAAEAAVTAYQWGMYTWADMWASRAIERRPQFALPYAVRSASRLYQGDVEAAHTDLAQYLTTAGDPTWGLELVARACLANGQEEMAEGLLLGLAGSLDFVEAMPVLVGLADALEVYQDAGRTEAGLAFVQTHYPHLRSFPAVLGDPEPLALLLRDAEGVEASIQVYRRALQQRPEDPTLLLGLARWLLEQGEDLDLAAGLCYRAFVSGQEWTPDLLALLARIHHRQGFQDRAAQEMHSAILGLDPQDAHFRENLRRLTEQYHQITGSSSP